MQKAGITPLPDCLLLTAYCLLPIYPPCLHASVVSRLGR